MKPRGYGFNPDRLQKIRCLRGLTQGQLAEAVSLSRINIVRYEKGIYEPRLSTVQALAKALEVPPKYFFEWPDEPQTPEASVEALQVLSRNLQLLTRVDLLALRALSENLAQSDNPLDYDQDLYDRDLEELQIMAPEAFRRARHVCGLNLKEVSLASGLDSTRLADIEGNRKPSIQADEILALRKALGVAFDPRAIASRSSLLSRKDPREPKTRHHDSVEEWFKRCQRAPNLVTRLLDQVESLTARVRALEKSPKRKP